MELIARRTTTAVLISNHLPPPSSDSDISEESPAACSRGIRAALDSHRSHSIGTPPETLHLECHVEDGQVRIVAEASNNRGEEVAELPSWWSLLPPVVAIFVALGTRRLLLGLVLAVWLGALLIRGIDPSLGLVPAIREFIWGAVSDRFRLTIVIFTSALVGMANVTTRSGGSKGIAETISRLARGTRSTRLATFLMGIALFFDDYANCIVVGTTMRPLADRVKLSREKLAYLVDSTAAPIAGVAIISTWIGYEVALFDELSTELGLGAGGYDLFLQVLPSRFYCFLTLVFVLLCTLLSRDFGPMLTAERRAQETGKILADDARPLTSPIISRIAPVDGVKPRWFVAGVPVFVVILCTLVGLVWSGASSTEVGRWAANNARSLLDLDYLRRCLQNADGAFVLLNAALAGSIAAFGFALTRRIENRAENETLRTRWRDLLAATTLPIGLALLVILVHSTSLVPDHRPWTLTFWSSAVGLAQPRVVIIAALVGSVFLGTQIVRRITAERARSDVSHPLSMGSLVVAWLSGARAMALAVAILVLAWSIQDVCNALDTSVFLVATLQGALHPVVLPIIVFLLAAAVAFSTGTSWGTMGILIPTALPLAFHLGGLPLLVITAGAVLDGAIFGDHCSPISDTTVLSSLASSCDHLHHVKTQLPYALTCMGLAVTAYFIVAAGVPVVVGYVLCILVMLAVLRFVGRTVGKGG